MAGREATEAELLSRLHPHKAWDPYHQKWVYRVEFDGMKGNTITVDQYEALGGKHLPGHGK